MVGYIFAFISSVFFSLYVVPRKLCHLHPVIFSFFMSLSFFIGSLFIYLLQPIIGFHEALSIKLFWSILAGIIWATSFVLFVNSIDLIGLSKSNQWKNLQGPVSVFLSLIILSEFTKASPTLTIFAAMAIFISALLFNITNKVDKVQNSRGVYFALLSGLGFGTVAVIQKYLTTTVGVYSQQVFWSLSIALCLLIYILMTKKIRELQNGKTKDYILSGMAGLLYLGASFAQLFSYNYLAASISFPLIQMNALWTVAIGIFVFKEIDFRKHYARVLLGMLFTVVGIILLALAKK